MGEVGAKLCPRRSKLEPSWRQDGPILSLSGRIETILGGILVIFLDSGQDLCRNRRSVKTTNPPSLMVFFQGSGPSWNGPGSCLGECWRGILEDVGSKMMFLEASLTMLRDLGAKMANKSAKMIFTVCFSYLHCKSVNFTMCF